LELNIFFTVELLGVKLSHKHIKVSVLSAGSKDTTNVQNKGNCQYATI